MKMLLHELAARENDGDEFHATAGAGIADEARPIEPDEIRETGRKLRVLAGMILPK